ncbi:hypothetical protein [Fimbriimonas ginsengisoli]|uniref:Uncharacterized protein n=1 Tax=Fimbriimonas ginsengisoli Gsoil 348 TaxID=661478 RepID=A0A068NQB2_FIMGI|nr:hypothetical protein [Fimbriimonas ginsengisoli]AIE85758.1 hypothetical protein OP10G_2390 [Fimbriimonas ginsengisoli Gsoil 348]
MAYILHARTLPGEMPRMVWLEPTGEGDTVRITVANAMGMVATGTGRADELEALASGSGSCACSGDIWIERTDNAQSWNLAFIPSVGIGTIEVGSFDFACALQRVQFERMSLEAASAITDGPTRCTDLRLWENLVTSRGMAFDS